MHRLSLEPPSSPEAYAFVHPVRVRFAETDAMGIVHHAAYLPYLEEARVEYMRSLGQSYDEVNRRDQVHFAVLEVYLRYQRPLRFDDVVDVHLLVGEVTRVTLQIAYLLQVDGVTHATGVTVHGCVDATGRAARMPAWLRPNAP